MSLQGLYSKPADPQNDVISTAIHSVFTHLDKKDSYSRTLFVDFSSAFNTISPMNLGEIGLLHISWKWLEIAFASQSLA